jgi:RIO kinase 1
MIDPLAPLVADGIIDEVFSRLKSGKEADIYLVQHGGQLVAAKVYKDRAVRSFQNNAAYKEGRAVRSSRTQRAIDKGSRFGKQAAEDAWKTRESEALATLHAAGVRVPKPQLFYEGVLLMDVVVDAEGRPAPRLIDAAVPRERAAELYADLRQQAVRMLACDLIHGDLSPYNVLLAWNGPTVIDLPQVVGAAHNSQAERFFRRDLEAIRSFFAAVDPALHARAGDAAEIWQAYVRRELRPDFVPSGRAVPVRHEPRQDTRQEQRRTGGHPQRGNPSGGNSAGGNPQRGNLPGGGSVGGHPQRGNPQRRGGGPVVTYVGQPQAPSTAPTPPAQHSRRRRRRHRHGGGPPPRQ